MDSGAHSGDGEGRVVLEGAHLVHARRLVETCLLNPAGDAIGDGDEDTGSAAVYHAAADLMTRLGWPDDPRRSVELQPEEAALVRSAALAGLGAAAEAIDDTVSAVAVHGTHWDADGALTEFEETVALLDVVGWPPGSFRTRTPRGAPAPPEETTLIEFGRRLPTPMWILQADGRMLHRNDAATALLHEFGFTASERPVFEVIHPDDRAAVRAHILAAGAEERGFRKEVRFGTGAVRRFILSGAPRFDSAGAFLGFMVLAIDVPPDNGTVLQWGTDASGALVSASRGLLRHLGMELREALGDGWIGCVHPDDRDHLRRALRAAHEGHGALSHIVRLRNGDGHWHPARLEAEPRLEAAGFAGLSGVLVPCGTGGGNLR